MVVDGETSTPIGTVWYVHSSVSAVFCVTNFVHQPKMKRKSVSVLTKSGEKKTRVFQRFEMRDFFDRRDRAVPCLPEDVFEQEYDEEEFEKQQPARRKDLATIRSFLEYLGYVDLPSVGRFRDPLIDTVRDLLNTEKESLISLAKKCALYMRMGKGLTKLSDLRNLTMEQIHTLVPGTKYPDESRRFCELLRLVYKAQQKPEQKETKYKMEDGFAVPYLATSKYAGLHEVAENNVGDVSARIAACTDTKKQRYVEVVKLRLV